MTREAYTSTVRRKALTESKELKNHNVHLVLGVHALEHECIVSSQQKGIHVHVKISYDNDAKQNKQ